MAFAKAVSIFVEPFLSRAASREAAEQLLSSSSSVASNYRAAGRARSHAEFTAKIGGVLEEADESQFWLEYLKLCGWARPGEVDPLLSEATELVAIFTKSHQTARKRDEDEKRSRRRRRRKP